MSKLECIEYDCEDCDVKGLLRYPFREGQEPRWKDNVCAPCFKKRYPKKK